ncbi:MAG: keto-deoxy-phosphogluconate aldolase, partial [Cellvibrionales bacterium]
MTALPLQPLINARIVPVVVIERLEDALPLARALYAGGLSTLEITLR